MAEVPKRLSEPSFVEIAKKHGGRGVERAFNRRFFGTFYKVARAQVGSALADRLVPPMLCHCGGIETGNGTGLYWWNFGFITAWDAQHAGSAGHFKFTDTHPVYDSDGNYLRNDPHESWFRAWKTEIEGVTDQITFVHARKPRAWASITTGDPVDYLVMLKRDGYLGGHGETDAQLRAAMSARLERCLADVADLRPSLARSALGIASIGLAAAAAIAGARHLGHRVPLLDGE